MQLELDEIASPLGTILLVSGPEGVYALDFDDFGPRMRALLEKERGAVRLLPGAGRRDNAARVQAYLDGDLAALDSLRVETGGTDFQKSVWHALRRIPCGRTATYGEIAAAIGQPSAARAVGHANAQNPVAIVVPCHRVVGADGTLTGYAGGLERKRWLLQHEGAALL